MSSGFEYYFRIRIFQYSTTALLIDLLLPCVSRMVNVSLSQGRLPVSQRHATDTRYTATEEGMSECGRHNFRNSEMLSRG